ncbi:calcium-translocating P-type ATPase, PMCA-type [Purpureocillium lilacinum]|uniref:Calcium-transporting ATPase n=1 Tax=Purpureocillium lilacinum TaxID=33203 RepID=A0A179GX82_PURLI|nr:calcium-translocating P-type ATPase, PMCA-type [Purpureocillium lilacinum]OAQ82585.1 calcium-translocating P-type ATPase, PMCA-type [Purpureocillium lilacinum]
MGPQKKVPSLKIVPPDAGTSTPPNGEADYDQSNTYHPDPPSPEDHNTLDIPHTRSRSTSGNLTKTASTDTKSSERHLLRPDDSTLHGDVPPSPSSTLQLNPRDIPSIEGNPFAFGPDHLEKLINPKSLTAFTALGGLAGLERGLKTDRHSGLGIDEGCISDPITLEEAVSTTSRGGPHEPGRQGRSEPGQHDGKGSNAFADRKRIFGENVLPERKSKSFLQLAWIALQDRVLILLSVAAVVSLALGLYQTFGQTHHEGAKVEWVEGVAIIVAIAIVVLVGALNDWQKERQFRALNRKKEDRLVKVIRSGNPMTLSVHDVLVGDVMLMEPGDVVPADGVFIDGHNLSCDESSATGESDIVKKRPADDVLQELLHDKAPRLRKMDPFIISGARVLDGVGKLLVTAVGQNSSHGRTMMLLREDPGLTPLQSKLNVLAGYIAKLGSGAGCLLFVVLLIEFLARLPGNEESPEEKGQNFLQILITSITIIVVAVPEGLPLAVTLSLAFATRRMTRENNLVRHLQSCETMGNATVICSDKTGTLTENVMTVVAGALGSRPALLFGQGGDSAGIKAEDPKKEGVSGPSATHCEGPGQSVNIQLNQLTSRLDKKFQSLLRVSIAINTTAFEGKEGEKQAFVGTKTETALLDWARRCFGLGPVSVERANSHLHQLFPFNSSLKCMGAVVQMPEQDSVTHSQRYRLFVKGAPEIVLAQCTGALDDVTDHPSRVPFSETQKEDVTRTIVGFASRSLRTLALAYRDFNGWPPNAGEGPGPEAEAESTEVGLTDIFRDMTWIGVVGIQDPVRQGVPAAIEDCRQASVSVKMVTGDNIETARAIGRECGILADQHDEQGSVMEGQQFRCLSDEDKASVAQRLCVLARSSPEDKRILVKVLKDLEEIVAVTGDGTNDAPALKAADVGFSMGITGTEVAKEASDIILMDDNFTSIVKALGWGRAINDSVKKFLQFQLTVNITAVIITFVTAVSDSEETSVLNAVQLLWVNLIMDTFAALALATDPPSESTLHRRPEPRGASLITLTMWKMILGQSIYQLIVCFVLWFAGPSTLGYPEKQLRTLIFNVFVFMQIFKLINSRRIDNRLNIFEGLHRNWMFMFMMAIMVGGQLIIIYVGGEAFVVVRLTGTQWAISICLGFGSIPIGILIRLFPDAVLRKCVEAFRQYWPRWLRLPRKKRRDKVKTPPADGVERYNAVFSDIRDDLDFLRRVRGGRIRALSEALARSPKAKPSDFRPTVRSGSKTRRRSSSARSSNTTPISPMLSAVGMPGIVFASVGGLSAVNERPQNH